MFKKLQKSVIDKNKLLLTNLSKKRVNKTPSKIVFPNRTNLTFANIIVNMSSTPSLSSIDNWNNSYFTTELYNNSFTSKSKNNINQIIHNNSEATGSHSKILSIIINGILSLKSNDLLNYCMKIIEIIIYIRDNIDKNDYIDINNEMNKDLLMIIYQTYFQVFNDDNIISILLKKDVNNGLKIFKNVHSIYIFFILSGIVYIYYNIKNENTSFYNFLKNLIKNEKCNDLECHLCNQIDKIEQNILNINNKNQINNVQKPSVIKIVGRYIKKNKNINYCNTNFNKVFNLKQKPKNNINNSNDNIKRKKNNNSQSHNKDKSFNKNKGKNYSHILSERSNKKILDINKCKNNIFNNNNKKKTFFSQIIKASEKEKKQFFNDSFTMKDKSNSKNKLQIYTTEKNILDNSNDNNTHKEKKFLTEINDNRNKKIIKVREYSNLIDEIKIKLYKNNKPIKKSEFKIDNKNKLIDTFDNNNNNNSNNKIIEINKKDKMYLNKNKKIKINSSTDVKIKKESKNKINKDCYEKVYTNISDNKEYMEINYNINKSSMAIKENINAIEKDIKDFKAHNNYIKEQLYCLIKRNNDH